MGSEDSIYEPSVSYMSEGNAGGRGIKPTATLRIFNSDQGHQWLMYGTLSGASQDYEKVAGEEKPSCDWIDLYYHGIMRHDGKESYGFWKVKIKGKMLDGLAGKIAAHACPFIRPGRNDDPGNPYSISEIMIEPIEGIE